MFKTLLSKSLKIFELLLLFNKSLLLMNLSTILSEDRLNYGSIMAFHTFSLTISVNISYLLRERTAYCSDTVSLLNAIESLNRLLLFQEVSCPIATS